MKIGKIYIILMENEIRYVGQTWLGLKSRIKSHFNPSFKDKTYRAHLFKKAKRLSIPTEIKTIQEGFTNQKDLDLCEKYWISYFKTNGCKLANATDGGYGGRQKPDTVRKYSLKKAGLAEDDEKFICLNYPTQNTHELAKRFDVGHQCIANILRRNGIKLRTNSESQGGPPANKHQEIIELYLKGVSTPKIGQIFNVSKTCIVNCLKNNGIKIRSNSEAQKLRNTSL